MRLYYVGVYRNDFISTRLVDVCLYRLNVKTKPRKTNQVDVSYCYELIVQWFLKYVNI